MADDRKAAIDAALDELEALESQAYEMAEQIRDVKDKLKRLMPDSGDGDG